MALRPRAPTTDLGTDTEDAMTRLEGRLRSLTHVAR